MTVFAPEENLTAVDSFVSAIRKMGYTADSTLADIPAGYTYSYVLVKDRTRRVLSFNTAGNKIDIFHGVFSLKNGSRTLRTWYVQSHAKLASVLEGIAQQEPPANSGH